MQGLKVKYIPNSTGPSGTQSGPRMFVSRMERWWKRAREGTVPSEDIEKGMAEGSLGDTGKCSRMRVEWPQLTWRIIKPSPHSVDKNEWSCLFQPHSPDPCSFPFSPFPFSSTISCNPTFSLLPIPSLPFSALFSSLRIISFSLSLCQE